MRPFFKTAFFLYCHCKKHSKGGILQMIGREGSNRQMGDQNEAN
ncbi:hypothetical protein CHCC20441_0972 [Bacillus licheniformis]|nr:hypothetical protein B14_03488 [Bacillus licheniformis]EQM29332.1 hypothetical protein N399_04510 [Bacillus licheniformis CG-B52]AVI48629.1 hypothetical protein BL14DL4_03462 [Bacillus licheniformis]KJE31374.1 hypothetical protein LG49_583 [Bacillus licheniformis]OAZ60867.1 hypothetical protein SRCM100115_03967 [Bacillus licheniformis]